MDLVFTLLAARLGFCDGAKTAVGGVWAKGDGPLGGTFSWEESGPYWGFHVLAMLGFWPGIWGFLTEHKKDYRTFP